MLLQTGLNRKGPVFFWSLILKIKRPDRGPVSCGHKSGPVTVFLQSCDWTFKHYSFFIHVSIPHFLNLSFHSLLDCGSSHSFLDEHFAHANHFPISLIMPIGLCPLDGSLAAQETASLALAVFECL